MPACSQKTRSRPGQQLINGTTVGAGQPSNNVADTSILDLQLQRYIHHLTTPAAPTAWWQLCQAIVSKGLEGLQSGLDPDQKILPDVQHAAGGPIGITS